MIRSSYSLEEFNDVVFLPPLFYLPRGNEVEILKEIASKTVISGHDVKILIEQYPEQIERLQLYGLIDVETDEFDKKYRIKITSIGRFIFNQIFDLIS